MSQEIGNLDTTAVDMSLGNSLDKTRKQVQAIFYHMFDDQVYKIDKDLFSTKLDKKMDNEVKKKKKRGLFGHRPTKEELKEEEERQQRLQMTPYEKQRDEIDKLLLM